jgi:hypothetical protein
VGEWIPRTPAAGLNLDRHDAHVVVACVAGGKQTWVLKRHLEDLLEVGPWHLL